MVYITCDEDTQKKAETKVGEKSVTACDIYV